MVEIWGSFLIRHIHLFINVYVKIKNEPLNKVKSDVYEEI